MESSPCVGLRHRENAGDVLSPPRPHLRNVQRELEHREQLGVLRRAQGAEDLHSTLLVDRLPERGAEARDERRDSIVLLDTVRFAVQPRDDLLDVPGDVPFVFCLDCFHGSPFFCGPAQLTIS